MKVTVVHFGAALAGLVVAGSAASQDSSLGARHAEETPHSIYFNLLGSQNEGENSALSGVCSGDTSSREIECKFWQTRVWRKLKPEALQEERKKMRQMLQEEKDFTRLADLYCEDLTHAAQQKNAGKLNDYETAQLQDIQNFCRSPSLDGAWDLIERSLIAETRTCRVSSDTLPTASSFRKVAPNKWVSSGEPVGTCNVVYLVVLEHEPDNPSLWTYTQTRTYADQDSDLCKALELDKTMTYSWRSRTRQVNCEFIEFGL